jgi:hypothetical protein
MRGKLLELVKASVLGIIDNDSVLDMGVSKADCVTFSVLLELKLPDTALLIGGRAVPDSLEVEST